MEATQHATMKATQETIMEAAQEDSTMRAKQEAAEESKRTITMFKEDRMKLVFSEIRLMDYNDPNKS